jgi:hypothetical protein
MSDFIKPIKKSDRVGFTQPKASEHTPYTPAPRRDAAGSVGAFDPQKTVSASNTVPRAARPSHGDFIENSMDPTGSTHVHNHIMHGASPLLHGVNSSHGMPKKGFVDFHQGDAGKGTNYSPHADAGHKGTDGF